MDVFGKICSPTGGQIDHSDFQELFDQVVKAGFKNINLTSVGRGNPVNGPEAMLIIDSATLGDSETRILGTALSELFNGLTFVIQSGGEDTLELKEDAGTAIEAVLDRRTQNLASIRESEEQRALESTAVRPSKPVEDESWRQRAVVRNGRITDVLPAD